jgi:Uma2 family endonuclease
MARSSERQSTVLEEVYYPETDEEPMGETDFHAIAMILLREGLVDFFAPQPRVYVASNMFLYYVEGDATRNKSPDVMVVKGVGKHFREVFKTWEEGAVPSVAFEIVSKRTRREDVGPKRREYARIGVNEYFLFDPQGRYLEPVLQGYRLTGRRYMPLPAAADGSLTSEELGLRLVPEGYLLRLTDARTGERVLTREEKAERERVRADALAAEVERLRAEKAQSEVGRKSSRRNHKRRPS